MTTATKEKAKSLQKALADVPRVEEMLKTEGTKYMGACLVQSPGAWTRVGPTWLVPGLGWVTYGPGARRWGTEKGLAELATGDSTNTEWDAEGVSISPNPNVVYAVSDHSLKTNPKLSRAAELHQQAG